MDWTRPISARARIVSPLALAATALIPRAALAGPTTPQKSDRNDRPAADPLTALLSLVPASATGSADNALIATYANMAAQLAAGDIETPDSIDDEPAFTRWIHASYPITFASPWRDYALVLNRDLIGYDVTDLDQTLEVGEPPYMISLLRGRFDRDAVAAAWDANGYTMGEIDGIPVATLFEDVEIDLSIEISRLALARMNNAAFLPDGTLAYAASLPLMEQVIATVNGEVQPLSARIDVAALLAAVDQPLASAIFVSGSAFSAASMGLPDAPADAVTLEEHLPPIAFGVIGITPGGPTLIYDEDEDPLIELPPATIVYRLLMTQPGSAEAAAPIVERRLSTLSSAIARQPYSELFDSWEATPIAEGDVLALDMQPADGRPLTIWYSPLYMRDLLFLAW